MVRRVGVKTSVKKKGPKELDDRTPCFGTPTFPHPRPRVALDFTTPKNVPPSSPILGLPLSSEKKSKKAKSKKDKKGGKANQGPSASQKTGRGARGSKATSVPQEPRRGAYGIWNSNVPEEPRRGAHGDEARFAGRENASGSDREYTLSRADWNLYADNFPVYISSAVEEILPDNILSPRVTNTELQTTHEDPLAAPSIESRLNVDSAPFIPSSASRISAGKGAEVVAENLDSEKVNEQSLVEISNGNAWKDYNSDSESDSSSDDHSFVSATSESSVERKERFRMSDKQENKNYRFDGSNVEEFIIRMKFGLMGEGLESLIRSTDEEKRYREDSETNRETNPEYKKFRKRNGEALSYLARHMTTRVMMRVDKSITAAQMYETVMKLYKTASDVGRDSARQDFFTLKYNEGGDVRKYIEIFEQKAEKFRAAGGQLDDQEELEQFRTSLPSTYNDVRKWFSSLPTENKTYENLKRQVIEDYEYRAREKRTEDKTAMMQRAMIPQHPVRNDPRQTSFGRGNGRGYVPTNDRRYPNPSQQQNGPKRCHECTGIGHFVRDCPSRVRRNEDRGYDGRRVDQNNRRYSEPIRNNNSNDHRNNTSDRRESRNDDWRNRSTGNTNTRDGTFWENFHDSKNDRYEGNRGDRNNEQTQKSNERTHQNAAPNQRNQPTSNGRGGRSQIPFMFVIQTDVQVPSEHQKLTFGPRKRICKEKLKLVFDFEKRDSNNVPRAEQKNEPIATVNIAHLYNDGDAEQAVMLHTSSDRDDELSNSVRSMMFDSGASDHVTNELEGMTDVNENAVNCSIVGAKNDFMMKCTTMGDMRIVTMNRYGELHTVTLKNVLYTPEINTKLMSEDKITQFGGDVFLNGNIVDVYLRDDPTVSVFVGIRKNRGKRVHYIPETIASKYDDEEILNLPEFQEVMEILRNEKNPLNFILPTDVLALPANTRNELENSIVIDDPSENEETHEPEKNEKEILKWHKRLGHMPASYLQRMPLVVKGMPKLKVSLNSFSECSVCIRAKSCRKPHTKVRERAIRALQIVCSDVMGPLVEVPETGGKYVLSFIDDSSNFVHVYIISARSQVAESFRAYISEVKHTHPDALLTKFRCDNAREYVMGEMEEFCRRNSVGMSPAPPYTAELNGKAERMNRTLMERARAMMLEASFEKTDWHFAVKAAAYTINRSTCRANPENRTPYELFYGKMPDISNLRIFGCVAYHHTDEAVRKRHPGTSKIEPRAVPRIHVGYTETGYLLMDVKSKTTYRSCNVDHVESENRSDLLKLLEDENTAKELFGLFSEEQPDLESETLDHPYAMYFVSNLKGGEKLGDCVPRNYDEAIESNFAGEWKDAMREELQAFVDTDTFELVPRPVDKKIIGTKWVFTPKNGPNGEYAKSRLVAVGCQDPRKWDNTDTYSPVINPCIFRFLISVANKHDLDLITLDVKNAFLYGDIGYEVFIEIPSGVAYDRKKYAFRLKKSLYGLKTSSRSWFERLRSAILDMKYVESRLDQCIFYKRDGDNLAIVVIYVDDMMLATNCPKWREETLRSFENDFKMKINYEPTCFLGVEFHRDRANRKFFIHQKPYTEKLIHRFHLTGANPQYTPMETRLCIEKTGVKNESTELRSMIGGLLFLARNTRPDIAYAVGYLSRFQTEARPEIINCVKRIMRYLIGTIDYGLEYKSHGKNALTCFVDASFATAKDSAYESTTGFVIYNYGNLVNWGSRKQSAAQTSTAAAEYAALNDAAKELVFLRHLNKEIFGLDEPAKVLEDNTSTIHIAEGTETTESRFLMTRFHQARQMVRDGEIEISHISGKEQIADVLTKAVDRTVFEEMRNYLVRPCSISRDSEYF